ncbi:uncharacterized protein C23H3.12c-like isoform X1 [Salvia hispanica]|uniref:uncharacterized protein C23H3.12c-like isoform X1 n=1 Tax=Salvia hispanica TaxID=49212 RepID=UPI002009B14D|nr:uncharacterized protein C23H3.12c-like isoform X1 [Salvia hispanica]
MRAKVVVFPIRGRNWCFSRSIDPSAAAAQPSTAPSTVKELWSKLSSDKPSEDSKVELAVDFFANKMNGAWTKLEKAPQGTLKSKIHGLGVKLLSRVKPSEIFFKSIPKEINRVDIVYPSSLNPRLVRRRLRHLAFRGSVIHTKYFYCSAMMVPLTSVFMVLPLPNIPFFWLSFRAYSHWRASQGSEKLMHLVTDASYRPNPSDQTSKTEDSSTQDKNSGNSTNSLFVFQPSEELEKLIQKKDSENGLSECAISKICQKHYLIDADVKKYRDSV